jgi:hypothetical protein
LQGESDTRGPVDDRAHPAEAGCTWPFKKACPHAGSLRVVSQATAACQSYLRNSLAGQRYALASNTHIVDADGFAVQAESHRWQRHRIVGLSVTIGQSFTRRIPQDAACALHGINVCHAQPHNLRHRHYTSAPFSSDHVLIPPPNQVFCPPPHSVPLTTPPRPNKPGQYHCSCISLDHPWPSRRRPLPFRTPPVRTPGSPCSCSRSEPLSDADNLLSRLLGPAARPPSSDSPAALLRVTKFPLPPALASTSSTQRSLEAQRPAQARNQDHTRPQRLQLAARLPAHTLLLLQASCRSCTSATDQPQRDGLQLPDPCVQRGH